MKKTHISILLLAIIFLMYSPYIAAAKNSNVADCLENGDCQDEADNDAMETNGANEPEVFKKTGSLIFDMLKMVFALLLVLGLIYLLIKFLGRRNRLFQHVKGLENLGGISVGQNKSIQIIRIGSKLYLIGVGDNVEMLQEITDDQMLEDLLQEEDTAAPQGITRFSSLIKQNQTYNKTAEKNRELSFQQLFAHEVKKLQQTRKRLVNEQTEKEDKK